MQQERRYGEPSSPPPAYQKSNPAYPTPRSWSNWLPEWIPSWTWPAGRSPSDSPSDSPPSYQAVPVYQPRAQYLDLRSDLCTTRTADDYDEIIFVCGTRSDWLYTDKESRMFPKHLVFKDETTKGSALGNEGNRSICVQYFEWLNVPEPDRCITSIDVWEEGNRLTLYKSEAFAREFNFPRYDDWKQAPNPNPFMPPVIKTPAEYDESLISHSLSSHFLSKI